MDSRGTKGRNPDMENRWVIQQETSKRPIRHGVDHILQKNGPLADRIILGKKTLTASSFHAEMLGLCLLHLLVCAITEYHNAETRSAVMSCNNKQALELSSHHKRRIQPSTKCADIGQSSRLKHIRKKLNWKIPNRKKLGFVALEQQIRANRMHTHSSQGTQASKKDHTQATLAHFFNKHPHPSNAFNTLKSYKCLRKLDWTGYRSSPCVKGYTLCLLLAFCQQYSYFVDLRPKGLGAFCAWFSRPVATLLW